MLRAIVSTTTSDEMPLPIKRISLKGHETQRLIKSSYARRDQLIPPKERPAHLMRGATSSFRAKNTDDVVGLTEI